MRGRGQGDGDVAPLSIWAVSDGRAGIENQALGLAEAVARLTPAEVTLKRVRWRGPLRPLPTRAILAPRLALDSGADALEPPWPDLWIGNGRASVPYGIAVRRWSGGRTFVVQLQDPKRPPRLFDLVVPPEHDRVTGRNVLPILGSPHRVTPAKLAAELARFRERLDPLPRPRIAALIGGRSRAFDLPPARAVEIADQLAAAVGESGGSLLLTVSRRTPPDAERILRERLREVPGWFWDGQGDNPYFAFLAAADAVIVTEDSVNMAAEAASTGAPVLVAPLVGRSRKIARFHAALQAWGAARPFAGRLEHWRYDPLRETDRAAAEVLRRFTSRLT